MIGKGKDGLKARVQLRVHPIDGSFEQCLNELRLGETMYKLSRQGLT
jgi:hypothetical protein